MSFCSVPEDLDAYPSFAHLCVDLQDMIIDRTTCTYRLLTIDRHFFLYISASANSLPKKLWHSLKITKTIAVGYNDYGLLAPRLHGVQLYLTPVDEEYAFGKVRYASAYSMTQNNVQQLLRHISVCPLLLLISIIRMYFSAGKTDFGSYRHR